MNKLIILIVLDSVGIGSLPDADKYNDVDADTLGNLYKYIPDFSLPNMEKLGLTHIDGINITKQEISPIGAYGKMTEKSIGKDTTTGHWEIAGIISDKPFSVYPNGFPKSITDEFKDVTGYDFLCNKPYSGTEVIRDYGIEHIKTGKPIIYTSADSVFQIAAHEDIIQLDELYEICRKTRLLLNKYNIGRVIARPFTGNTADTFKRTSYRKDFSLKPPYATVLDKVKAANIPVIGIGKINDIFAGCGISRSIHTKSNKEGILEIINCMNIVASGLIFANLVDFDMLYGHRNDPIGYASALMYFDSQLRQIINLVRDDDILIITADHGCDPHFVKSTDHTREYVPLIVYGKHIKNANLGIRTSFADIGASISEYFGLKPTQYGTSFLSEIM